MYFNTIVSTIAYSIGIISLIGIWFSFGIKISKVRERLRLSREIRLANYQSTWLKNKWLKQYHFLLASAWEKYEIEHFSKVISTQFTIFISMNLLLVIALREIMFPIFSAVLIVYIIPITFLYIRHKQKQNVLQNELIETSVILLQEYEKNHKNMLFALKEVLNETKGFSHVAYAKLFARMHGNKETKELAAETFAFQLGHVKGRNLAIIILRACDEQVDVTTLLEDLVFDLTEFSKRTRDAETEAGETAIMGYAPIPALIILYFVNDLLLIPDGNTFHYQFKTELGIKSFLLAFIFGILGIFLASVVKKPKKM